MIFFKIIKILEKPKIEFDKTAIDSKAGEKLEIRADISGLPTPDCIWLKDGSKLTANGNTTITSKDGVASVVIKNADAGCSGVYKLMVENEFGKDEGEVTVQIKGVPSAPVGPLEVTDITDVSCKITWRPPEHDGNSKLLGYCVEKREAKKSTWAFVTRTTSTTAEISGLSDTTKYYFRVTAENAFGNGPAVDTKQPVQPKKSTAGEEKPKITKAPEDTVGKQGDKLTLRVEFTGKPAPEVRWYKDDELILPNENIDVAVTSTASALTIEKLDQQNSGDYRLVLQSKKTLVEHKFKVAVNSEPVIIDADKYSHEHLVFQKGENVTLQLNFSGQLS
ncbi:unnamed protein product [Gongylonema pulchrum]|uniref:Immunoglobulin I-set domain protein n=1 Tax=Gongylonema pulchrum TaxID=637853 RepID=A0A183D0G6_9BILA|nr:unnamed protein product [Gongylonema pulchrum]